MDPVHPALQGLCFPRAQTVTGTAGVEALNLGSIPAQAASLALADGAASGRTINIAAQISDVAANGSVAHRRVAGGFVTWRFMRSEEHTSELQSLMRNSY